MDGLTLLEKARSAGLTVIAQGDKLVVRGPRNAGPLAEQLLTNKGEVLDALLLESVSPADLPSEWHFVWEERAAIMEYCGHIPHETVDVLALLDILRQMPPKDRVDLLDRIRSTRYNLAHGKATQKTE